MVKVCILQNKVLHYRKPLYNKLSETHDLTIIHSGDPTVGVDDNYREIILPLSKKGPFLIQKKLNKKLKEENFDVIIGMLDLHWIGIINAFRKFKEKFIWWGIGVSEKEIGNKIRAKIIKKGAPMIFYTKEGVEAFSKLGVNKTNLFYCNNTFHIENRIPCFRHDDKKSILFVGSLDQRKQNDVLLKAFKNIQNSIHPNIYLEIIGGGIQEDYLKKLSQDLQIENNVIFHGSINDTGKLEDFYKTAICSVSFGQAGLAVLQSLGYGVPFITKRNAISGGEKNNIKDNFNGYFCDDSIKSLEEKLLLLCNDIPLAKALGENAFNYYTQHCTIENMANVFSNVIKLRS